MELRLTIPDHIYARYQLIHKTKSEEEVKSLLKARLLRWLDVLILADPTDRTFLIDGDRRRQLESIVQTTVADADDLIKKTRQLACVKIGTLEFSLTAGEALRLKEQAKFHGWDPAKFVEMNCREIFDYFMGRI